MFNKSLWSSLLRENKNFRHVWIKGYWSTTNQIASTQNCFDSKLFYSIDKLIFHKKYFYFLILLWKKKENPEVNTRRSFQEGRRAVIWTLLFFSNLSFPGALFLLFTVASFSGEVSGTCMRISVIWSPAPTKCCKCISKSKHSHFSFFTEFCNRVYGLQFLL